MRRGLVALVALLAGVAAAQETAQEGAFATGGTSETGAVERAFAPRPRPEAPAPPTAQPAEPTPPDASAPRTAEPPPPPSPPPGVQLRALDKFSGLATLLGAEIGVETSYGRLRITVRSCERGAQGDVAYLVIVDAKAPGTPVFEGWMFAESPALSALDHPRYDVWLASCSTRSAEGG